MLRVNDILLAVEALTQERFSDLKAYRNVVRKGFKRPSFLTEVGKQTMEVTWPSSACQPTTASRLP